MTEKVSRGRLKVFISYAAGVGKTYHLLIEGHRLRRGGIDVVLAFFNPHAYGRQDTIALTRGLESVPAKTIRSRGSRFADMDTDAVIRRRPQLALVDELPHTNAPGSPRTKRWQDVQVLLDAGIDVTTAMNVTHLDSLRDQVWRSTGVRMRETVPDSVLNEADEIVMIDLPPRMLLQRLQGGLIYPPARARVARQNFFRESALVELRALALQYTSHVIETVDAVEDDAVEDDAAKDLPNTTRLIVEAGEPERLVLFIEPDPASATLIRRGQSIARCSSAECYAIFVSKNGDLSDLAPEARNAVERTLNYARGLGMDARILEGDDIAKTVVEFARLYDARHIFILRHANHAVRRMFGRRGLAQQIVRLATDMQIHVVAA
jgi:two-component system sensor histidine kinase KdpD